MASLLSEDARKELIRPVLANLIDDKSWRVRYMVAEKLTDIQSAIGEDMSLSELVPAYVNLLKDPEGEVRCAAAQRLQSMMIFVVVYFNNLISRIILQGAP